jgi:hypothetical protein
MLDYWLPQEVRSTARLGRTRQTAALGKTYNHERSKT